jgi:hypothetical protein
LRRQAEILRISKEAAGFPGGSFLAVCAFAKQKGHSPFGKCPCSTRKLLAAETLVEALNTSAGIDELLLAGIERMALGANFDVDFRLCAARVDDVATCTGNRALNVLRVNTLFHSFHLISVLTFWGHILMYAPITTFNFGYPNERPWKRLL